jgi:hypothetical protein
MAEPKPVVAGTAAAAAAAFVAFVVVFVALVALGGIVVLWTRKRRFKNRSYPIYYTMRLDPEFHNS